MESRRIVAGYLFIQALGTAAWWGMLISLPESVRWFQPTGWPPGSLLGFWLADTTLLVGGSLISAWAVLREKHFASLAVWMLAAAVWYPTLYCVGVSVITDQAWIAASMMAAMGGLTLAMATIQGCGDQSPDAIRVTRLSKPVAVLWTLFQTAIFWSIFLWILPQGIVEFEHRLSWPVMPIGGTGLLSLALFASASLLGIWSGLTMAARGRGTPLPTATAPDMVVTGPYRFVRNPMAVAGILQGIAVGWYLGSYSVIAYSLAGAILWHVFVRPVEEADLRHRFGDAYIRYRNTVRLWIPTIRSFAS